ncbi:hypothetical protein MSAR_01450 [Mycolicibacterium sarraceniae]|uniref:Endoglycoceramidase n=1 Tax=Mycolicibacterium sarraceniae TaxID=1534348 RepID=A0A7I7SLB5_9MYCO|nr:hypothetical protein MSAR_01450 [Mycolicibacterium sarraceniae]
MQSRSGSGVASTPRAAAAATNSATTPTSAAVAQISVPPNLSAVFHQAVYTPLHAVVQAWILSEVGRQVDDFINGAAGSYVIGNGVAGTEDHRNGGAAGWLGNHGAVGTSGAAAVATQPTGPLRPLTNTGTWLTTSDGQVVIVHGLNEVYKVAPYEPSASGFDEADAQFLQDNGFNVVRLGVIWAGVEPNSGEINTAYLDSIQQTVDMLADHGIYTIIDLHQDLYSSEFYGEGAPDWASDGGGRSNKNSGFPGNYYVNSAMNHAWDAIRSVDGITALYLEPPNPAVTEVPTLLGLPVALLGRIGDPNFVLAFHDYCGPIGGALCTKIANTLAAQPRSYSKRHNVPAVMNEFGATSEASTLTKEMSAGDRYLMGWAEWAYTGEGDMTGSPDVKGLVYDPALLPVGDNVNAGNVAILSSPYPQIVSGTPSAWSFKNGTLDFSYSTAKVHGSGTFDQGSLSTFSVPQVQYPNGYQVTVTGGRVVSASNAAQLVIASDQGATTISVVVSPAT